MTKGLDVATSQAGLDLAKLTGYEFVIVKAGGFNVKPLYVAPHYHEQIDGAVEAGLKKGHYWIVGNGDPVTEADFFVNHLYRFDAAHDVLVLDNERLDSNATLWGDAQIAAFAQRVISKTGIHPHRFLLYMGAYNVRTGTFSATNRLDIGYWVASYGADDGTRSEPDLGGKWPRYDLHQYTSSAHLVQGKSSFTLDLDWSSLPVDALFTDPIERDGYFRGSDGAVYAVTLSTHTKKYITWPKWQVLKRVHGASTLVADYWLNQLKTVS